MRALRKARKLRLQDVATATGILVATLSRIETAGQLPNRNDARALFDFYEGTLELGEIYDPFFERDRAREQAGRR